MRGGRRVRPSIDIAIASLLASPLREASYPATATIAMRVPSGHLGRLDSGNNYPFGFWYIIIGYSLHVVCF